MKVYNKCKRILIYISDLKPPLAKRMQQYMGVKEYLLCDIEFPSINGRKVKA